MLVKEILNITKGRLVSGSPDIEIIPSKISTDSRTIGRGGFFIGIGGPNFDGNDFVQKAFDKGSIGALLTVYKARPCDDKKIIIKVKDTLKAFHAIAAYHRRKFNLPVIGVTGSNGKTTTKEMIWSVLSRKYNVLKNEGTKNNHIGVPQTLLKLNASHDICVLEMGMNHKGEIRTLTKIARPNVAVITNIGPSHLEFLEGVKDVFNVKREILESLDRNDVAILNGDDEYLLKIKHASFDILRFGLGKYNDYRATDVVIGKNRVRFRLNRKAARPLAEKGGINFELNLLGLHNIYNALAAIAVGSRFDISYESMSKSILNYKPIHMRLNFKRVNGIGIIDDTYNSNPASMRSALEALKNYPARSRWVVAGDMLELGGSGKDFHKMIGRMIAETGVDGLVTFGSLSEITLSAASSYGMCKKNLRHCSTHDDIAKVLKRLVKRGDVVLIKGSRAMKTEEVIKRLTAYS